MPPVTTSLPWTLPCPVPLSQPGWAERAVFTHSPASPGFVWKSLGPALGEGTAKRVGMATGLGSGRGEPCRGVQLLPKPSRGLTPACLLGALLAGRAEAWGRRGQGFPASAETLTFPHRVFEWYGRQPAGLLFSACQPPGYPGEGRGAAGG